MEHEINCGDRLPGLDWRIIAMGQAQSTLTSAQIAAELGVDVEQLTEFASEVEGES